MFSFDKIKSSQFAKQLTLKLVLMIGAFVILAVVLIICNKTVAKDTDKIQTIRGAIQNTTSQTDIFASLVKDYQTLSPYLESVKAMLPTRDKLIDFSQALSEVAENNNLEFGFIFEDSPDANNISQVYFSMTLKGEYSDFINFIENLKKMPYFIDLDSFDLSGPPIDEIVKGITSISGVVRGKVFINSDIVK